MDLLRSRNGLVAHFTNYDARWVSMWTPDRNGSLSDIILDFLSSRVIRDSLRDEAGEIYRHTAEYQFDLIKE